MGSSSELTERWANDPLWALLGGQGGTGMTPYALHQGDCRDVMAGMDANSVDAIVCDPPYGLRFMSKGWDHGVPGVEFWEAAKRVAKPGAHLLAFGGTRTFHRLTVAIEDAGWEIRDTIMWVYGSGFPKSLDVSKAIDAAAGCERPRVPGGQGGTNAILGTRKSGEAISGEAISGEAATWQGWGTALKPAWEPIIVARKPLAGTVAANVLRYGTGGINIDACRIELSEDDPNHRPTPSLSNRGANSMFGSGGHTGDTLTALGRWPANLIHDGSEEAVAGFPQAGGGFGVSGGDPDGKGIYGKRFPRGNMATVGYGDSGSAARFFYCAKASKADRESGLDSIEIVTVQCSSWENADHKARLRVDTAQSPPRVIAVSGAPCNDARAWNMLLFGSPSTVPCLLVNKSTIETATNSTTESRTLNWLVRSNTSGCTAVASCETEHGGSLAESAEFGTPSLTITSEWTVSARGVERVQSPMRLSISGNAGSPADHPTVKPTDLMRYLCRLVTPPNGIVIDPFMGSGSTGKAATLEGFHFIGIEREEAYCEIAAKRIQAAERESAERLVPA